jgi:hypothetical protein
VLSRTSSCRPRGMRPPRRHQLVRRRTSPGSGGRRHRGPLRRRWGEAATPISARRPNEAVAPRPGRSSPSWDLAELACPDRRSSSQDLADPQTAPLPLRLYSPKTPAHHWCGSGHVQSPSSPSAVVLVQFHARRRRCTGRQ